ncbi:MAG: hypothetical protein GWN58_11140 [Anaerolineae bacterium]|nr:hypothetical protein [Anaerolineae bacterium]
MNLWKAQNVYYDMLQAIYPEYRARSDEQAQQWTSGFRALGENLTIRLD